MDNTEHATIDVQKLAASLRENLETMLPLSDKCCIYRVPQKIRCLNESAFTPQVISIGPLHHGKEELKAAEQYKRRYLKHFLQRTEVSIEDFLTLIKDKEAKLRNSYAGNIVLASEDFVRMILVDGLFLIECFLRFSDDELESNDDHMVVDFEYDLYLLENQLPFFILNELFILAKTAMSGEMYKELSFIKLIKSPIRSLAADELLIEDNILEKNLSKAEHILDLLRLCLELPGESDTQEEPDQEEEEEEQKEDDSIIPKNTPTAKELPQAPKNIPTATELHQAGVKFMTGSSKNLFEITFNRGIFEIPQLTIYESFESLFRNLLAFETLHCDTTYINDYIILMKNVVVTAKDAELLVQNGVINNWRGDSQAVSSVLHNLDRQATLYADDFQYLVLVENLKAYCRYPWHNWKATLKQNYFNTPWAFISVIAAVILLLLTITQTVCSLIAL